MLIATPVSFINFCMAEGSGTALSLHYCGHLNNFQLKMFPGQKLELCLTSTLSFIMSIKLLLLWPHIRLESRCYGQHTEFPNQISMGGTFLWHLETLSY